MKIKICYVIGTLDIGGAEKQLLMLSRGLDKQKFSSVVISLRNGGPLKKDFEISGIKVIEAGKKFKIDILFFFRLLKIIKKERPEILHTFMFTSNTWGRVAGILSNVPVIISSERCVDIFKKCHHRLIDRILLLFTKTIVANSQAVKTFYQKTEGIPESKIKVICNGIEIKNSGNKGEEAKINIEKKKELDLEKAGYVIGCGGRFTKQKGFIYLIKAIPLILKYFPQAYFIFAGDGLLKDVFKKTTIDLGIEKNIIFTGYRKDIANIFAVCDIISVPSLFEGMPNVVLEAMALSKPVVGTDIPEIAELVKNGKNGFLVPVKNSISLAEKIIYLLENPSLCKKMGEEGFRLAKEKFSSEKMIKNYEILYNGLLSRN
jgi:glycosyltransferase involved in cell wall biosynthesis